MYQLRYFCSSHVFRHLIRPPTVIVNKFMGSILGWDSHYRRNNHAVSMYVYLSTWLQVHFILHVPTGAVDVNPAGQFYMHKEPHLRLNALIRRFSSGENAVIVGVYGTHVHSDSFKMYYDVQGNKSLRNEFQMKRNAFQIKRSEFQIKARIGLDRESAHQPSCFTT